MLYGTHSWTPREDELRKLWTTQNRMMRKTCAKPRHPDQSWFEWVQRGTHKAKEVAAQAGVRDWVVAHATRKWSWAGHVMRRSEANWINSVTVWRDSVWNQVAMEMGGQRFVRPSRRRWMKWEDPLRRFAQEELHYSWTQASAQRTDTWNEKAAAFATWFSKR